MKVSSMLNNWSEVRFDRCLQEFCDIKFFCSLDLKSQWKCIHWIDKHWQLRKQHHNQRQTQLQQCLLRLLLVLNLAERGFWRIEIRDHAFVCMHGWCDMFYTQQLGLAPGGGWCSSVSDRSSYWYLDFLESFNPTYLLSIMCPSFIIILKIALQFNHCQLPSLLLFLEIVLKKLEFRMRMKNVTPCSWQ